ncbi:MAG: hypothetical protein Q4F66_09245 [Clostridium sp.]|nr:hypothetical protein [Clostridium sp.]
MIKKIALILIASTLFISGCSMQEERIAQPNESQKEEDGVAIENNITINVDSECQTFYGSKKKFQNIKPEYFFDNTKSLKEEWSKELEMKTWTDKNDNYLAVSVGDIYYTTASFSYAYENLLYDENGCLRDNFNQICSEKEISELSKEEVRTKINSLVEKCEIEVTQQDIYTLDQETLKKLSNLFMSDKEYEEYSSDPTNEPLKRDFAKEDEAYLIVMKPGVGENSLYNKDYEYTNTGYTGSKMFAVVNKEGMQAFIVNSIYEIDNSKTKTIKVMDKDSALQKLQTKYSDLISDSKIECKDIQLTYVAYTENIQKGPFQFIPAYVFFVQQEQNSKKEGDTSTKIITKTELLLDAEKGDWIE